MFWLTRKKLPGFVFPLHHDKPRIGVRAHGSPHQAIVFAMASEIEIQPSVRMTLHVGPEVTRPCDVRRIVSGIDHIASMLSMSVVLRAPNAVGSESNGATALPHPTGTCA